MKAGRQLIIFRDSSELPYIRKLLSHPQSRPAIVAVSNADLMQKASRLEGVQGIFFIELPESIFDVAPTVIAVVGQINTWLSSLLEQGAGLPAALIHWPSNVEGGITNQRVQEAVLLLRSYDAILINHRVEEIRGFAHADWIWEDLLLREVARSKSIPFRLDRRYFALRKHRRVAANILRPFMKGAYYLVNICRLRRGKNSPVDPGGIAFQIFGSSPKHVENVAPIQRALLHRKQSTVAWCWAASERISRNSAERQLRLKEIPVLRMERTLGWRDIAASISVAFRCWWKARRIRQPLLIVEGVSLESVLSDSLRHFFVAELPQRYRFFRAMERCFEESRPSALKIWGGPESFEGQVTVELKRRSGRPMLFHYWIGASMNWPYPAPGPTIDLFLAKGAREAALAANEYRLSAKDVVVVGQARTAGYRNFSVSRSSDTSRTALGLPAGKAIYVGYDPNAILRGLQSAAEQFQAASSLVRIAERTPGLVLVVKPHPLYSIEHIAPLFANPAQSNIFVLPAKSPVEDFINACDIIITKYSTLILEAALMGRVAISVLFNTDDRFRVYGDIPETVRTAEDLETLLDRISKNSEEFSSWRNTRLHEQQAALPEFYHQPAGDPAERAADAIMKHLVERGELNLGCIGD